VPADATGKGETWRVSVVANDGISDSDPAEAEALVVNTPPVATVAVSPTAPVTLDDLVATASAEDADGDPVSLTYTWSVDGVAAGYSGETIPADATSKGETWTVTVTPHDGEEVGEPASFDVVIGNTAPSVASVWLDPSEFGAGAEVACVPGGWFDEDGDTEDYAFEWFFNGASVATSATLAGAFVRGDEVQCAATPMDGTDTGSPVTSDVALVGNTPPSVDAAHLSTTSLGEGDTLSVTLTGVIDIDGDDVTYTYDWYVGGVWTSGAETLDGAFFAKGDEIYVVVTPADPTDAGAPVTSDVAWVGNTPPTVTDVVLSPAAPSTDDTLTATATTSDADSDGLTYTYDWYVDGVLVQSGASDTLSGSAFERDDGVYVVVTVTDGTDTASATSASVTVWNSAPGAPVVSIDPADPLSTEDLLCGVDAASADAEGDAVTYTFTWTVDGVAFGGAGTTTRTGDTIDAGDTSEGEVWTCTVTPTDGTDDGAAAAASVTVGDDGGVAILVISGTDSAGNSHVTDAEVTADFRTAGGALPTLTRATVAPDSVDGYAGYDIVIVSEDAYNSYASVIGSTFDAASVDAMFDFWQSGGNVYFAREQGNDDVMAELYWQVTGTSASWTGITTASYSATLPANAGTLFAGTTRAFLETGGRSSDLGNPTLAAPFVNAFNMPGHTPTVATVIYVCEADGSGLLVIDGERGTPWYAAPAESVDPSTGTFGPAVGDMMAGGPTWSRTADCADSDGDGLKNGVEGYAADTDGDGTLDYLDRR
jgi:hypothetical protein